MENLKILEDWSDIPQHIVDEICQNQTNDVLERYDNSAYHNQDIIHNTLQEYGYKLKD